MKFSNAILSTIIALSVSTFAFSKDVKKVHSFGVQFGGGGLEYKGQGTDGQGVGQFYTYYNYNFAPNLYIEAALVGGEDVDDWRCNENYNDDWECYNDDSDNFEFITDDFEFSALVFTLKADVKLSQRNKLYAKVGAEFYEYEFKLRRHEIIDEDGTGILLEAGWEYRWDMGIGMNASLQYNDMDDLEMSALNVGISYAF
jgi:hypothetical protein